MTRSGYDGGNTTGFVSPASDNLEGPIDLSEILDLRRPHRYPVRVKGDALSDRLCKPHAATALSVSPQRCRALASPSPAAHATGHDPQFLNFWAMHWDASSWALAIWAGVIFLAISSRYGAASLMSPSMAATLYHMRAFR